MTVLRQIDKLRFVSKIDNPMEKSSEAWKFIENRLLLYQCYEWLVKFEKKKKCPIITSLNNLKTWQLFQSSSTSNLPPHRVVECDIGSIFNLIVIAKLYVILRLFALIIIFLVFLYIFWFHGFCNSYFEFFSMHTYIIIICTYVAMIL